MTRGLEHAWDLTPRQAIALQEDLRDRVRTTPSLELRSIKSIAGADCAFDRDGRHGYAGVVVYSYPELKEIQRVGRRGLIKFPYVPGLLSFREAPLLLAAIEKLSKLPDVLVIDGHGVAHPRRFGIASHLGVLLNLPTIGCAKSRLVGEHSMPASAPGSTAPLTHKGQLIGEVLRTRKRCRPVYVSIGHRISQRTATRVILSCVNKYRIPIPTRDADLYVARLKLKSGK